MATFYYLRGTKEEKKIYISVTSGATFAVQRATKFTVHVDDWDKNTNRLLNTRGRTATDKLRQIEIEKFNAELTQYQSKVDDYLTELKQTNLLTENKIIDFISSLNAGKKGREIPTDFTGFLEYYLSTKHWLSDGTNKAYNRTGNLVGRVYPKLRMSDIDDNFKKNMAQWMKDNQYQMSYIRKSLKNVRDYWKYAKDKGLKVSNDPETWELTKEFPDLKDQTYTDPYLSLAELEKIKELQFSSDYLDNARDWLLISCWTAQRVSDLMQFSADKVIDHGGEKFITIIQKKTQKEITIPLFKEVDAILKKRNGNFPRSISEQKYNEYIKKVCEQAKMTELVHGAKKRQKTIVNGRTAYRNSVGYFPKYELITSHVGRRSFISNFLRQIDYDKIKQISGHKHASMVELYDKLEGINKAAMLKSDFKNVGIE